jgi:hypothetical protein
MEVTHQSRTAVSRAELFVRLASECPSHQRTECEAFIEAAIVFARAAIHRLQKKHHRHPEWEAWWSSLLANPSAEFFRTERDWLLKEAPPKIGQRGFVGCAGGQDSYEPSRASEFYFFDLPSVPATVTLAHHLKEIARLVDEAEAVFEARQ